MTTNPNYISFFNNPSAVNSIDDAVQNGSNESYKFNELVLENLFFNPLFEPIRGKDLNGPDLRKYWLEDDYEYRRNKYCFRSSEFKENEQLLFAGCSHTYGMGVPEDMIWGVQIANRLNLSYSNLGIPGASVSTIVNNIFAYFRLFGHPKILVIIFPNFERLMLPVNTNILVPSTRNYSNYVKNNLPLNDLYLEHSYLVENTQPKFSKKPHNVDEVIPLDVPYWMATQSINLLEQYCDMAKVKLIWSTWDYMTYRSLKKMNSKDNSYFKHMVDIEMDKWVSFDPLGPDVYHNNPVLLDDKCLSRQTCDLAINCHNDIRNKYEKIFDLAADNGHWGTHRHTHIAETLSKYIVETL